MMLVRVEGGGTWADVDAVSSWSGLRMAERTVDLSGVALSSHRGVKYGMPGFSGSSANNRSGSDLVRYDRSPVRICRRRGRSQVVSEVKCGWIS